MSTRQFGASVVVAAVVCSVSAGTASAQPSISWSAGYPVGTNVNPGPPQILGKIDGMADITGFGNTITSASFNWMLVGGGGQVFGVPASWGNGKVGQPDAQGNITKPVTISGLAKGTYEVWITVFAAGTGYKTTTLRVTIN